ncbi:hypothetical protein SAMN04488524_3434 [Pedobacter africanus]|uniref:Uncharacterized protein n=1 Tax=Pedobacter africanus TaxID=151894 RepID=A0A1W2D071_9SPHI|nr:hypothetical protein SAMN04488524_3434 [Pedobacter africanus]
MNHTFTYNYYVELLTLRTFITTEAYSEFKCPINWVKNLDVVITGNYIY